MATTEATMPVEAQPMSMMTIKTKPSDDLLTIRILESSERKLRMIKQLLSPEEFNSLAPNLLISTDDDLDDDHLDSSSGGENSARKRTRLKRSFQAGLSWNDPKGSSRPEKGSLTSLHKGHANKRLSAKERLVLKQQAIEFFFVDQEPHESSRPIERAELAIELRSGHYLSAPVENSNQSKLVQSGGFSALDRIYSLLELVGFKLTRFERSGSEQKFEKLVCDRASKLGWPYNRTRNVEAMMRRVVADGRMDTITQQSELAFELGHYSSGCELGSSFERLKSLDTKHPSARVLEPVGHFIKLRLLRPKPTRDLTSKWVESELIGDDNKVAEFGDQQRTRLSCGLVDEIQNNSYLSNRYLCYVRLQLRELIVLDCELMSQEERLSLILADQWHAYCNQLEATRRLYQEFEQLTKGFDRRNPIELKRKFDATIAQCERSSLAKQELLSTAGELDAERKRQEFSSTGATVKIASGASAKEKNKESNTLERMLAELLINLKDIYNQLVSSVPDKSLVEQYEMLIDYFEHCLATKSELMRAGSRISMESMRFKSNGVKITSQELCPIEEAERRSKLELWIGSLELRLLIGQRYVYQCKLGATGESSGQMRLRIALEQHNLLVPVPIQSDQIKIEFELVQTSRKALISALKPIDECFETFRRLGSATTSLETDKVKQSLESRAEMVQMGERSIAKVAFDFCVSPICGAKGLEVDFDLCKQVDRLYRSCFDMEHTCDNVETMLSRLINSPEHRFNLLGLLDDKRRARLADLLVGIVDGKSDDEPAQTSLDANEAMLRRRGHVWRRVDKQPVETEGSSAEGAQLPLRADDTRAFLAASDTRDELDRLGYKCIDLTRKRATAYLRQCELRLEQLIAAHATQKARAHRNGTKPPASLLSEPQIRMMDVSGVARVARKMVPKRGAPRPLRPKRKLASKRSMAEASVAIMAANEELDVERGAQVSRADDAARTRETDSLARSVADHWRQRCAPHMRPPNQSDLRLVVTVQQVTNAPLRIVRHTPPTLRTGSPYPSAFSRTFGGGGGGGAMSPASRPLSPAAGSLISSYLLAPPNTYVEVVFQRRKLATSLAYGKDPIWNETLFFPIETASARSAPNSVRLADECLQVNLYDFQCHPKSDAAAAAAAASQADDLRLAQLTASVSETLAVGSQSAPGASQLVASQQRVERHLLGSLTVPLTVLLTNGRLDGSFALNQPLLLDEYQFDHADTPLLAAPASARGQQRRRRSRSMVRRAHTSLIGLFVTLDPPVSVPLRLYLPAAVCCARDTHLSHHFYHYCRLFEQVASTLHNVGRNSAIGGAAAAGAPVRSYLRHSRAAKLGRADRNVRALVWSDAGELRAVCAHLLPVEPPQELVVGAGAGGRLHLRLLCHKLARFVALVSPLKYGVFAERLLAPSVWFSGGQLLAGALGGVEEKAVLLCNYFLHLGRCAALLFGDSLPAGRCVFVIVWRDHLRHHKWNRPNASRPKPVDSTDFIDRLPILIKSDAVELWDPNAGKCYAISSSQTPLLSVGSVATVENVYANIQLSDQAHEISFDIRSSRCWLALLDTALPTGSVGSAAPPSSSLDALARQLSQAASSLQRLSARKQVAHLEQLRRSFGPHPLLGSALEPVDHFGVKSPLDAQQVVAHLASLSRAQCDELRDAIERQVRASLISWRADRPTYMNRTLSHMIAGKLAQFESLVWRENARESELDDDDDDDDDADDDADDSNNNRDDNNSNADELDTLGHAYDGTGSEQPPAADWRAQLAEVLRNEVLALGSSVFVDTGVAQVRRKLVSFPMNVAFTSMRAILDLVYASNVHAADLMLADGAALPDGSSSARHTQFLIASHVEPYPARVCSVWLYVGALVSMGPPSTSAPPPLLTATPTPTPMTTTMTLSGQL